ncbi:MAG: heat-inducible transcriptional repressor HrcA [Pseudomonadota bacterium]
MAKTDTDVDLDARSQHLLKGLIEQYIRDGQPVGSRVLSRESGLDLSPATVRNVMADLEDLGLIRAPHTSAGRIPTARGYRLFVEQLLTVRTLEDAEVRRLEARIGTIGDRQNVLASASRVLSDLTRLAGVVSVPRPATEALRQVEFLPLSGNQVLVILVVNEQEVQNRIIRTDRHYSAGELTQAANYLNEQYAGQELGEVRTQLLRELRAAREQLDRMMSAVVEMAEKALEGKRATSDDLVVSGQTNLIGAAEFHDVTALRQLFDAFQVKRDILHLMDQSQRADGIQLFIGEETGYDVLESCSIVTSPYEVDGEICGVLGIVGPTRMPYEDIIPVVDMTARLVGSALNTEH